MHPEGEVDPIFATVEPEAHENTITHTGRLKRQRFLPAAFRDFIPSQSNLSSTIPTRTRHGSTPPIPNSLSSAPASRTPSPPPEPTMLSTDPDEFGLFREYTSFPTYEPDDFTSLDEICDAATFNIFNEGEQ
ncbi:hypothetical protein C8R42DRAFT_719382 [Lentinula raphanica]|nr:hypothetical protein C8R42DRAFT_719382 [Lentinula raphanica]